eukprot:2148785-Pyramimonas_sp.AAC.2
MRTWVSPPEATGRALAARAKSGLIYTCPMVVYFLPRPRYRAHRPQYFATVRLLVAWISMVLRELPHRCTPLLYCDLNDGLGQSRGSHG